MLNINPYNKEKFFKEFSSTDTYKKLVQDFDFVSFDWYLSIKKTDYTARQLLGDRTNPYTRFSAVTFYYLNFLLEQNPETIYDLGCGWNIFKKYIPNLIGVGAEDPAMPYFYADIHDFVDDNFIQGHQNYFESLFSINALHFHPLSNFSTIVNNFYSMLTPHGRGFLALNLQRMIDRDHRFQTSSKEEIMQFLKDQFSNLSHINFLVVDIQPDPIDEALDGNVRLVMQK